MVWYENYSKPIIQVSFSTVKNANSAGEFEAAHEVVFDKNLERRSTTDRLVFLKRKLRVRQKSSADLITENKGKKIISTELSDACIKLPKMINKCICSNMGY